MKAVSSDHFAREFARLNTQQRQAVETIEGSVMVLAGPGTGKTQVLAMRIANILLKTDTSPYSILALTFTESAAKNMRERLVQLIGPTAYAVHVQTFHAFCDEVIQANPEYFPITQESQVLSDLERYDVMEHVLRDAAKNLTALRTVNSPFHYLKPILKAISDLKREGVSEARFAELVKKEAAQFVTDEPKMKKAEFVRRKKILTKQQELVQIFSLYQSELQTRQRYDYDDMITFVARAFEKQEELLLAYQEKLQFFLVDEYQDTNSGQNAVVELLASFWGEQANLFVVGDPHQSIYRFQGASLENTLEFVEKYPAAAVISLETGYRCPQPVYDAAAEVIAHNAFDDKIFPQLAHALKSVQKASDEGRVRVHVAVSAGMETVFVAQQIQDLLQNGVKPEEVAVLYRNNADAVEIKDALEKWSVPFVIDGGKDALKDPVILQLLKLCKVIVEVRSAKESYELFEVMNYPWLQLDPTVVMKVARAAGKTKMSIIERIEKGFVEFVKLEFCDDVTALDFGLLENFVEKLRRWSQQDAELTLPMWFEMLMSESESGFLNWVLNQTERARILQHVQAIFREVSSPALSRVKLAQLLTAIGTMLTHGIAIVVEEWGTTNAAVTLSTVHKAKGREWQYVFLIHCIDGKWGNGRNLNMLPLPSGILAHREIARADQQEDDRRLFYVALTRAKKQVTISYAETTVTNNVTKSALGSMFLSEISAKNTVLIQEENTSAQEDSFLQKLLTPPTPMVRGVSEKAFLQRVVENFHLSASSLNDYLRSTDEFIERHLLKVPTATPAHMAFGTAVHFAFEQFFTALQKQKKAPTQKFLLQKFEEAMQREVFALDEYSLRLAHGKKILTQYVAEYSAEFPHIETLIIEKFFGFGWSKTMLGDIQLTGRIDRIDWLDKAKNTARVIDYKTGRARTLGEIEGTAGTTDFSARELALPKNIRGSYKRQLVFYKLLTQLDEHFSATVEEGVFDFIEPDRDRKFTRRTIKLIDEDVESLKILIREVMEEIRSLKFLS
jgi:DNA helicase-2/ATP-dependent DNA helicase PcrA